MYRVGTMTLNDLRKAFESQGPDDDMEKLKEQVCGNIVVFKPVVHVFIISLKRLYLIYRL